MNTIHVLQSWLTENYFVLSLYFSKHQHFENNTIFRLTFFKQTLLSPFKDQQI